MAVWQQQLKESIKTLGDLCAYLQLNLQDLHCDAAVTETFPLRVPYAFAEKMQKGNPSDPLFLQVLPQSSEQVAQPGYVLEPLAEKQFNPLPGLLHKYQSRILLTPTGGCAIHCRYCFRKHFAYHENAIGIPEWQAILHYLKEHPLVNEVIFSGGDPLLLSDAQWQKYLENLQQLPQIKRVRLHTRIPIVLPARISEALLAIFQKTTVPVIVAVHCNHPNELGEDVKMALRALKAVGVTLLNQSVLLKNINDDAIVLAALSEKLFDVGVLPYYLHALDPVLGTQHFAVLKASAIYAKLQTLLPGFLLPKFVREVVGVPHKTLII